jgi:release factor glutamine methyltransferase
MSLKTISALLNGARVAFKAIGIDTAALDARLLLQGASALSHEQIIAEADAALDPRTVSIFEHYVARRLKFEPVSRILGSREFYGRKFYVTPDVLDPRADTECVVALALAMVKHPARFLDLGTGSGAIAVTLCAERADFSGVASDVSAAALKVAENNAIENGVVGRLSFHRGSWFEGLSEKFDLIISNPPYIESSAPLMPDVLNYDPHLALFGGDDGLDAYRAIAAGAAAQLLPKGVVVVEIGAGQEADVDALFAAQKFELMETARDLAGHVRALKFGGI